MTRVGRMRHRVEVARKTVTKDERGEDVTTWKPVASLYCDIHHVTARERLAGMHVASESTYVFTSHYVPGICTTDRLEYDCRTFDIVSVVNVDERNRRLEIEAKEHK